MDLPRYNRKGKMVANDPTKHYPNKDEAKLLRKIMSDTGLTEEEVRAIKKYRVVLSEAQKKGNEYKYSSKNKRFYRWKLKQACRETKLPKEHPDTIKALQKILDNASNSSYCWWGLRTLMPAKDVVKIIGKNK